MTNSTFEINATFKLDHQEFGEVYYALVSQALRICPISWDKEAKIKKPDLVDFFELVFGQNFQNANIPRYNKTNFRNDLACRTDDFTNALAEWFDVAKGNHRHPNFELVDGEKIALIWNRRKEIDFRDSTDDSIKQLSKICKSMGYVTVLVGCGASNWKDLGIDYDRTNFYGYEKLNPIEQIHCLSLLVGKRLGLSIGLQSGAMDGLALFHGFPTIFLSSTETASNGMANLANRIPNLHWCEISNEKPFKKFSREELHEIENTISQIEIVNHAS